jgi:hypothetical protein
MLGDEWEPEGEPPIGDPGEEGDDEGVKHCDEFDDDY